MSDIEELDAIDEEFERLEEVRRHGVPTHTDGTGEDSYDYDEDDVDPYYTLPPSRVDIMKEWQEWRTVINDLMIDTGLNKNEDDATRDLDLLTSSGIAKTPDFFLGKNSIHGNRVKDEYGGEAITETDDNNTKVAKKIMEENFYLFGIPRIAVRRFSEDSSMHGSRRSSVTTTSPTSPTFPASDSNPVLTPVLTQRRGSLKASTDYGFSTIKPTEFKPSIQTFSLEPKTSKLDFFKKKFSKSSKGPQLPPRRRFSTGNM